MALPVKTRVGRGKQTFFDSTIDIANLASDSIDASNDIQVPGAKIGDVVDINFANEAAALTIEAYVSAANVVTVVVKNSTSGAVNAASSSFYGVVHHR